MRVRRFSEEDPEHPPVSGRRWAVGAAVGVAATVTAAVIGAGLLWSATAGAAAQPVETITPTATKSPDNVKTCEAAGLGGVILLSGEAEGENNAPDDSGPAGTATVSADGKILTVTIAPGFTVTGVVVKGGPNFNVYTGPFVGPIILADLQSPLNRGGNVPKISHYFVCGMQTTTTTTTAPPTTTTTTTAPPTTTTTTRTDTTTVTVTTTSTSLPVTGGSANGLLAAGAAMIAAGGVTLFLLRRRRALTGE